MDQPHTHGPGGEYIPLNDDPSEPDTPAEAAADIAETGAAADVEVAKIEAERDVELAKIGIKRDQLWQESRVSELEGEMRGMRETLERLTAPPAPDPAPEPEPVIIAPEPEPEPVEPPPAPVEENPKPAKKKSGFSWF